MGEFHSDSLVTDVSPTFQLSRAGRHGASGAPAQVVGAAAGKHAGKIRARLLTASVLRAQLAAQGLELARPRQVGQGQRVVGGAREIGAVEPPLIGHRLHAGDLGGSQVLEELGRIAPVIAVRGNVDGFAANAWAWHPLPDMATIPR